MLSKDQLAEAGEWTKLEPAISSKTLSTITKMGFQQLTPVQASAIPLFMQNKDVVVEAVTGSGKTFAFIIPLLEILYRQIRAGIFSRGRVGAVVISPTRELANQINQVLQSFLNSNDDSDDQYKLQSFLVTGGRAVDEDIREYRQSTAEIIIATPGKLEHFLASPAVDCKQLEVLVLDEADRLLDLGFHDCLQKILRFLPKQRRTGLFSATMTEALKELVKAGLRNPVKIVVKVEDISTGQVQRTPSTLQICYAVIEAHLKFDNLLYHILANPKEKIIVYFNTCLCVDYYFKIMQLLPFTANLKLFSLHGKMVNKRRKAVFEKFSNASAGVLLCTDIAARGLDIPDVDFVIQFDPPQDPHAFSHRCGRTARQGRLGRALVFLLPHETTFVQFMQNRKIPMLEYNSDPSSSVTLLPAIKQSITFPAYYKQSNEDNQLIKFIHSQLLSDRALYLLSIQAFVSYLKSYKEHQLSFVFPFQKLPLQSVVQSFFLLHRPKCPELRLVKLESFVDYIDPRVDAENIQFKDAVREKSRVDQMAKKRPIEENNKKLAKATEGWSKQKALKERRQERKEKKQRKREAIARNKQDDATNVTAHDDSDDDLEELERDHRMLKKLKQGKLVAEQDDSDDSDSDSDC